MLVSDQQKYPTLHKKLRITNHYLIWLSAGSNSTGNNMQATSAPMQYGTTSVNQQPLAQQAPIVVQQPMSSGPQPMSLGPQPMVSGLQPMSSGPQPVSGALQQMFMNDHSVLIQGQPVQGQGDQPTVYLAYTPKVRAVTRVKKNYKGTMSVILGALQIAAALLCIIFQSVGYHAQIAKRGYSNWDDADAYYIWAGIWGPVLFIVSGAFAIVAGKYKTSCWIVSTMVLSIISANAAIVLLAMAAWAIDHDTQAAPFYNAYRSTTQSLQHILDMQGKYIELSLSMGSLMLICSLVELVASVWISALSCATSCCCYMGPDDDIQVMYIQAPTSLIGQPGTLLGPDAVVQMQRGPPQYTALDVQTHRDENTPPPYSGPEKTLAS